MVTRWLLYSQALQGDTKKRQKQKPFTHDTWPKGQHRFAKTQIKKDFLERKTIKMENNFEAITQNVA